MPCRLIVGYVFLFCSHFCPLPPFAIRRHFIGMTKCQDVSQNAHRGRRSHLTLAVIVEGRRKIQINFGAYVECQTEANYCRAGAHGPALAGPLFSHLNLQKDQDTLIEQSTHYTLIEQSS